MFGRDRRILNTVESQDAFSRETRRTRGTTVTHKHDERIFFASWKIVRRTVSRKVLTLSDRIDDQKRRRPIGLQSLLVECLYKTALIDFAQQTVVDERFWICGLCLSIIFFDEAEDRLDTAHRRIRYLFVIFCAQEIDRPFEVPFLLGTDAELFLDHVDALFLVLLNKGKPFQIALEKSRNLVAIVLDVAARRRDHRMKIVNIRIRHIE